MAVARVCFTVGGSLTDWSTFRGSLQHMHESEGYMPYTPHGLFICLWAKVEFIEAKCCGLKSLRRRVLQVTLRLLVGTRFDLCSRASFYQGVWAKIWQIARGCSKLCEGQGMPGNMPAQTDLSQYPGCRCPVIFGLFQNNTVATL